LKERATSDDTSTIHKTRVAFKKFRYLVERLASHLPGVSKELLEAMRQYQTILGEIQDAEVMLRAFDKFARKRHLDPKVAEPFRQGWRRRRERRVKAFVRTADQLSDFWPILEGNSHDEESI
jgi:CHAD domain-containing protein